jgi:glycosyltransferase involved in cell wall biosynthesis
MSQSILIAEFDLYKNVGGGQTVYKQLIRHRPEDTFYYFIDQEAVDNQRPHNVQVIPFKRHFDHSIGFIPEHQRHFFYVYRDALDMARSAYEHLGKFRFDVVDTPDYRQLALFLRSAFESQGLSVQQVALALHGTLSSAFIHGWPWNDHPEKQFEELRVREQFQFRAADCRYAISETYAQQQQRQAPLPVNLIDPRLVVRDHEARIYQSEDRPPDLVFVGRRERRKGPDLFIDLAWWLPESAVRRTILIGEDGRNHQGRGADEIVTAMAKRRGVEFEFVPNLSQQQLRNLCQQKTIVLLPSRVDQFNLVALETLLDGCPAIVSRNSGVAQFIERHLPELSWLITDITCDRSAAMVVESIISDYPKKRKEISDAMVRMSNGLDHSSLRSIYTPANELDQQAQAIMADLADRFSTFSIRGSVAPGHDAPPSLALQARHYAAQIASIPALGRSLVFGYRSTRIAARFTKKAVLPTLMAMRHPRTALRNQVKSAVMAYGGFEGHVAGELSKIRAAHEVNHTVLTWNERRDVDRAKLLKYLSGIVSDRKLDRVRYFREMISVERRRGNDLIAATYGLRLMRWLGWDYFHLLPFVCRALTTDGYILEAATARAMYGEPEQSGAACRELLFDQLARHRTKPDLPFEILDDRRGDRSVKASIIVSLYRAADKLPAFMRMLRQQTMIRSGECEVVFIDSGSPTDEYEVFRSLLPDMPFPALYARSKSRETIQAAWNRGIKLAKGRYLAFLGVDEALHPEAMHILAHELDDNAEIDWVMANSVVTEVDRNGVFDHDVMSYDRTGYRQDWHYLDCTFLSYVGGLYRRSIHDRFGYYDESFKAAGDTEFKNRVLPYIKSKHVPKLLGIFNNYPEERTTQHPRAEIEDLRAWYLHRTPAGVGYAFNGRSNADAEMLLRDTLGYRKCFCQHISTDLDLADSLVRYLQREDNSSRLQDWAAEISKVKQLYESFELFQMHRSTRWTQFRFVTQWRNLKALRPLHQAQFGLGREPAYQIFNDNRHEQHWWSWSA